MNSNSASSSSNGGGGSMARRRFSQVYVEIPPSPLHRFRLSSKSRPGSATPSILHVSTTHTPNHNNNNRKENTPLRLPFNNMFQVPTTTTTTFSLNNSSTTGSRKRKLSESTSTNMALTSTSSNTDTDTAASKKRKLDKPVDKPRPTAAAKSRAKAKDDGLLPAINATEEFPNGFFYCHQCAKKRDSAGRSIYASSPPLPHSQKPPDNNVNCLPAGIHCTVKNPSLNNNRCKIKFCTPCLRNRQGEHVDAIKAAGKTSFDEGMHVQHESYTWK